MSDTVGLPYEPEDATIEYVPADNEYMQEAREVAEELSTDRNQPVGSVIVQGDEIIGEGANRSDYHNEVGCDREQLKEAGEISSGEGYELCDGCHPRTHSEAQAIEDARESGNADELEDADVYLWGHWWACESCWDRMEEVDIDTLYLHEDSETLFNKSDPDNILPT